MSVSEAAGVGKRRHGREWTASHSTVSEVVRIVGSTGHECVVGRRWHEGIVVAVVSHVTVVGYLRAVAHEGIVGPGGHEDVVGAGGHEGVAGTGRRRHSLTGHDGRIDRRLHQGLGVERG